MVIRQTFITLPCVAIPMSITENELREEISSFLRRNFPQIQMHGGDSVITKVDVENGVVGVQLTGACSGCGISPQTTQMIKHRMVEEMEYVNTVEVTTGLYDEHSVSNAGTNKDTTTDAPF